MTRKIEVIMKIFVDFIFVRADFQKMSQALKKSSPHVLCLSNQKVNQHFFKLTWLRLKEIQNYRNDTIRQEERFDWIKLHSSWNSGILSDHCDWNSDTVARFVSPKTTADKGLCWFENKLRYKKQWSLSFTISN